MYPTSTFCSKRAPQTLIMALGVGEVAAMAPNLSRSRPFSLVVALSSHAVPPGRVLKVAFPWMFSKP